MDVHNKIMYIVVDYSGTLCKPTIFSLGISSYTIISLSKNIISYYCNSVVLLYSSNEEKCEVDLLEEELIKLNIYITGKYDLSKNTTDFSYIFDDIYRNLYEDSCIVNFLSDILTNELITSLNIYFPISVDISIISLNIMFDYPITHSERVYHYIISYFNPNLVSGNYLDLANSYLSHTGEVLEYNKIIHNTVNAIILWKSLIQTYDSNDLKNYILSHQSITSIIYNDITLKIYLNNMLEHFFFVLNDTGINEYGDAQFDEIYVQNKVYPPYILKLNENMLCFFDNNGHFGMVEETNSIKIGILFSFSGNNRKSDYNLGFTAIAAVQELCDSIFFEVNEFNTTKLIYEVYDIKSSLDTCKEGYNYFINNNYEFIITDADIDCLYYIEENQNDYSPKIFSVYPTCSPICSKNMFFTNYILEQIIPTILSTFSLFIIEYKRVYYIDDSASSCFVPHLSGLDYAVGEYELIIYDISEKSIQEITTEIYSSPGLILSSLNLTNFLQFLKYYSSFSMGRDYWPVVTLSISYGDILKRVSEELLGDIYIPEPYLNNNYILNTFHYYFLNDDIFHLSSNVYYAFIIINYLVYEGYTIEKFYNDIIYDEIIGEINLQRNNHIGLPISIIRFDNYVKYENIYATNYLFYPVTSYNRDLNSINENYFCIFSDEYNGLQKVTHIRINFGIYVNSDEYIKLLYGLTEFINYISSKTRRNIVYVPEIHPFLNKEELYQFLQDFIEEDYYYVCFLSIPQNLIQDATEYIIKSDKLFFIGRIIDDFCIKNVVTTSTYSLHSLIIVIQQIILLLKGPQFILIYNVNFSDRFLKIINIMNEIGANVILKYCENNDILNIFDVIEPYIKEDKKYVIFGDISEEKLEIIENFVSSHRINYYNPVYYMKWFYEYNDLYKPNHFFYGYYKQEDSVYITPEEKRYYYNEYTELEPFNPYIISKILELTDLVYLWDIMATESPYNINLKSYYNRRYKSKFDDFLFLPNNRITKKLYLYYRDEDNNLFEYQLSEYISYLFYDINNTRDHSLYCNFLKYHNLTRIQTIPVGIISHNPSQSIYFERAMILYRYLSETIYCEDGLFYDYAILPTLYFVNSSDEYNALIKKLVDISSIAIFGISYYSINDSVEIIDNSNTLFFSVSHEIAFHCSENIFDVAPSVIIDARNFYNELSKHASMVIFIYNNNNIYDNTLIYYIKDFFKGTNMKYDEIDNDSIHIKELMYYCLSDSMIGKCGIVNLHFQSTLFDFYDYISNLNITFGKDMHIYSIKEDMILPRKYRKILDGGIIIGTYSASLTESDTYNEFQESLINEFSGIIHPFSLNEDAYTSYLIFKNIFSSVRVLDFKTLRHSLHDSYFSRSTGVAYFGEGNLLLRDVYISEIKENEEYSIIKDSKQIINENYYIPICGNDNDPIIVGLLFNFDNFNSFTSQISYNLLVELIINQNQNGGINNRMIQYKLYSLYQNVSDIITINNIISDNDINIIIGCYTKYCDDLIEEPIKGSNKLLYSVRNIHKSTSNKNIIRLGHTLYNRINISMSFIESSGFKDNVLIYIDSNEDLSVFNQFDNITFIKIYKLSYNNTDNLDSIINELYQLSISKQIIVLNCLEGELLSIFERKYIEKEIPVSNILQIFYYISENEIGTDIMPKLNGNIAIKSFIENSNDYLSLLFKTVVYSRIGNDLTVIQDYGFYELALKFLINAYKSAELLKISDGDNSNKYLYTDYLRRATQLLEIESSLGNVKGTDYNNILYSFEIGQISSLGTIISVQLSKTSHYINEITNPINYFGPIDVYKEINSTILYLVIGFGFIPVIFNIVMCITVYIYRKRLVKSSPFLLLLFGISSLLTMSTQMIFNLPLYKQFYCDLSIIFVYSAFINCLGLLVFRTWRIHSIYNNAKFKKARIKDSDILIKSVILITINVIISIIFSLFNILGKCSNKFVVGESTTLEKVYISRCEINIGYMSLQSVIILTVVLLGFYYSWKTRKTSSDFNDSRSLAVGIGFLLVSYVLIILFELTLEYELETKYIFEVISLSYFMAAALGLIIIPKLYKIYTSNRKVLPVTDSNVGSKDYSSTNCCLLPQNGKKSGSGSEGSGFGGSGSDSSYKASSSSDNDKIKHKSKQKQSYKSSSSSIHKINTKNNVKSK